MLERPAPVTAEPVWSTTEDLAVPAVVVPLVVPLVVLMVVAPLCGTTILTGRAAPVVGTP